MKLNPDCIRDILLVIEEKSTADSIITSDQLFKETLLSKYSKDEILYHLNQLYLSNYIICPREHKWIDGTFIVCDLSPQRS